MIVLDVNVLVAAYVSGHQFHTAARSFLHAALETGGVAAPDVVWSGFARVVTHPDLMRPPAAWPDLRAFADAIQRHPGYRSDVRGLTSPLNSLWTLCQTADARRNLVSDAYIAAVAIEHNAAVATWDADFARFPVPVVRPDGPPAQP
ncbi:MAG: PIN domain-containing protein [Propionibacteriaceae bacterium]|nr:PIN domain-containing protein [Propionibacteriaceae bacterium]